MTATFYPSSLLALRVRLGQPDRAEALARSVSNPDFQANVLNRVAMAVTETDPDRAEAPR